MRKGHITFKNGKKIHSAFTMAEVLITLVVIGIVATLVMPSVITRIKVKTYVTQFKKCHNNFANAFKSLMAHDSVTRLTSTVLWEKMPENIIRMDRITTPDYKNFMSEFSKAFRVVGFFSTDSLPERYKNYKIKPFDQHLEEAPTGFIFLSDESYLYLRLYKTPTNAECGSKKCDSLREFQTNRQSQSKFWQTVGYLIFDVNGIKEPNTYGRDVFIFYLDDFGTMYPEGGIEYAIFFAGNSSCSNKESMTSCAYHWSSSNANESCMPDKAKYGYGCAGRMVEEGWQMNY